MTITYITSATSVIATTGNGATMTWGDSLTVLAGAFVGTISPTGYGIALTGSSTLRSTLNIMGTVAADFGGVYIRDLSDGLANVTVSSTGAITSQRYAIQSAGSNTLQTLTLMNDGAITSSTGIAILAANTNLTIVNTGQIAGLHDGAAIFTSGAGTWVDILNAGTLIGGISAQGASGGLIEVENTGLIQGEVGLGDGSSGDLWLRNSGHIAGSVWMSGQSGHTLTADLAGGRISGGLTIDMTGTVVLDLTAARVGGTVQMTGTHSQANYAFQDARIGGELRLYQDNVVCDLTGVQVQGRLDIVSLTSDITLHAGQVGSILTFTGADRIDMVGATVRGRINLDDGNDILISGDSREKVEEFWGDDTYDLGGGDDLMIFGFGFFHDGHDTMNGGAGFDTLNFARVNTDQFYTDQTGALWVSLEEGLSRGATTNTINYFGIDVISGFEAIVGGAFADTLVGNAKANRLEGGLGDDTLTGNAGADTLVGGDGADRLTGGAGRDVMRGDGGVDVFVFAAATDSGITRTSRDQVLDFLGGTDRISLAAIDANSTLSGDQAFTFAGQVASSGAGTVRFAFDHGNTVIYLNLDADAAAESTLLLRGLVTLTAGDFLL